MKKTTLKILFAIMVFIVNQNVEAQRIKPKKIKSNIIVTTTLDLNSSPSSTNVTAYPNNTIYPGYYEVNMRVTAFVNTFQYGKFYLYPQRRVQGTNSWVYFTPNGTTMPNQFPNTGPLATPSPTYSGRARVLQYEGTVYEYRVRVIFYPTSGGYKSVYTPIRTATVLGVPKACFTMYNINSSQSENSYYGPVIVNTICQNAVTINGSCSKFEQGYFIRIAEFNLSTWTFGTDYYSGWVGSGEAPSFISLNALAASNGKYFQPGKLYIVALSIGPVWQSSPPQFFRVINTCKTSDENNQNSKDIASITLDDDSTSVKLEFYPNPAKDYIKISMDKFDSKNNASIKIFDSYGVQVYQGEMKTNNFEINTSRWKIGVYFCQIQIGDKRQTKKIIKNKEK